MKRLFLSVAVAAMGLILAGAVQSKPPLPGIPPGELPRPGIGPIKPVPPLPFRVEFHEKYRCPQEQCRTFTTHAAAHAFKARLDALGFQTTMSHAPNKYKVCYRLPYWKVKTFPNHAAAHAFKAWLESLGCQVVDVHHIHP